LTRVAPFMIVDRIHNRYPHIPLDDVKMILLEQMVEYLQKFNKAPGKPQKPTLVGIETNPGPKSKQKQSLRDSNRLELLKILDEELRVRKNTVPSKKPQNKSNKTNQALSILKGQSVSAPVAMGTRISTQQDRMTKRKDVTVHTGSELVLGSIAGSTGFGVANALSINPGNVTLFPRLSTLSSLFAQYRFTKLVFRYVPVVSTATAGDVMMIVDPDASNTPPTTENQAVDHQGARAGSVWEPLAYNVDVSTLNATQPFRYVRTASMPGDIKTFDVGNLYICTNNESGTSAIGKLFVDYTVELRAPLLINNQGLKSSTSAIWINTNTQSFTTGVTASAAFNSNPTGNAIGVTLAANTTDFTLPTGFWRIQGRATVKDTSAETFLAGIGIAVGGSPITTGSSGYINVTNVAGGYFTIDCDYVAAINSSSGVVNLQIELTGAAGTLTAIAQSIWICFTLL